MNVLLDALAVLEAQREAELRLAVPAREMRQVSVRDVHSMPYYAQHTPCSAASHPCAAALAYHLAAALMSRT